MFKTQFNCSFFSNLRFTDLNLKFWQTRWGSLLCSNPPYLLSLLVAHPARRRAEKHLISLSFSSSSWNHLIFHCTPRSPHLLARESWIRGLLTSHNLLFISPSTFFSIFLHFFFSFFFSFFCKLPIFKFLYVLKKIACNRYRQTTFR